MFLVLVTTLSSAEISAAPRAKASSTSKIDPRDVPVPESERLTRARRTVPVSHGLSPSMAERADDPSFVSVNVDRKRVSLGPTGAAPSKWTYKNLDATLIVDVSPAPPAAVVAAPADGSVITSLTPTLRVN